MQPLRTVDDVCAALNAIDQGALRWQMKKLRAVREWALRRINIDYREGDRVVICHDIPTDNGWYAYREALAEGATGVVTEIDFNPFSDDGLGAWHATVVLDRAWQVGELHDGVTKRWWKGRVADTPPGMEPPGRFDQQRYPDGKRKAFSLRIEWVRATTPASWRAKVVTAPGSDLLGDKECP